MTLTELKKHFYIYKINDEYRICSLTEHGRNPYKYLCSAKKKGRSFYVLGYDPTTNIVVFKNQVQDYVSKLEYDSEYFNPDYRKEAKEIFFVHDYMKSLGFENIRDESYVYNKKDIYGGETTKINLFFSGLDIDFFNHVITDEVKIVLSNGAYSWTTITVPRTFEGLKNGIDSFLKPLLATEAVKNLETSDKMIMGSVDYIKQSLDGLNVFSGDYKKELKRKLVEMAEAITIDEPEYENFDYLHSRVIDGRKETALIFFRKDLRKSSELKPFDTIEFEDLATSSSQTIRVNPLIIFIDHNGATKLLKNRWGNQGPVISKTRK